MIAAAKSARERAPTPVLTATTVLAALLLLIFVTGIAFGVSDLSAGRAVSLLIEPDASAASELIWDVRMPRALLAILVGANLAVAGVIIQTLTRNPLASPQTFGINAGAALLVVLSLVLWPTIQNYGTVWPSFVGAAAVGFAMWALTATGTMNEMKLALADISVQLMLAAMVQAILIADNSAQDIVYWLAGSINGAQWSRVFTILPFSAVGIAIAVAAGPHLDLFALDETTSRSLGQNTRYVGGLAAALIVLLAGSAVAVSGPIGFIGLLVPHIVRRLVSGGHAVHIGLSAIGGPILLSSADLLGRAATYPAETPVGIVTALIGAPAYLAILWRGRSR